jgi:putative DNA primase/helicase
MEELFSKHAQAYWAKGISVIPLYIGEKKPAVTEWSGFSWELPSKFLQEAWLRDYKYNNMGVVLGKQSNLVFLDIDSEDPVVQEAIMAVTPPSPWKRVGKKGCIYAYRYSGEKAQKIRAKDQPGYLLEILSTGNQGVLPPSIHPETNKPYVSNVPLLDVYDDLPYLPDSYVDRVKASLSKVVQLATSDGKSSSSNFSEFVSLGARDTYLTKNAGNLAFCVLRGERTLKEALVEMDNWCATKVADVEGDSIDPRKGMAKIIEFLKKDVGKGRMLPTGWDAELTIEEREKWGVDFGDDNQAWTVQQLTDHIFTEFKKCQSPTDPYRQDIIRFILNKVAKSKNLNEIDRGQILHLLKDNSGLKLPISFYNRELKALTAGPIEGNDHTEIALATKDLWEERYGPIVCYLGEFWGWEGHYWKPVNEDDIWKLISTEYGSLAAAKKANDHKGILTILKKHLPKKLSELESDGVNFRNGFLTKDLRFVPHQPEQGMTYVLPYSYNPKLAGKCPKFFNYLFKSWGQHPDYALKVEALREAMGATLFGLAPTLQRCFLLKGAGNTGKSVLLNVISNLIPPEAQCHLSPEQWGGEFNRSRFMGKLLNVVHELPEKAQIDGSVFKQIISGETMDARYLYKNLFTYKPKSAHWIGSNYFPKTRDISSGFNRRWLIFMFDRVIPDDEKILDYDKIIVSDEIEAIVAWAAEVVPNLLTKGSYTLPPSHMEATKEMAIGNSPIRAWMSEKVETAPGHKVYLTDLHTDFWRYALFQKQSTLLQITEFRQQLQEILKEEKNLEVEVSKIGEIYHNIKLKDKK